MRRASQKAVTNFRKKQSEGRGAIFFHTDGWWQENTNGTTAHKMTKQEIQKMFMPQYLAIKTHGTYAGAQTGREGESTHFG